jgi:hypothetical protein
MRDHWKTGSAISVSRNTEYDVSAYSVTLTFAAVFTLFLRKTTNVPAKHAVVSVAREVTINALRRDEYRGFSRAEAMSVNFGVCLSTTMNS